MNENGVLTLIDTGCSTTGARDFALLPLNDTTVLGRLVERVRMCPLAGPVVVVTTTDPRDDEIEALCVREGALCVRGRPEDPLDRQYQAARRLPAEHVARIRSDSPLIDPAVIDRVIAFYLERSTELDYVSNLHPLSDPEGNGVEVFSFAALEWAWRETRRHDEARDRPRRPRLDPELFRLGNSPAAIPVDLGARTGWRLADPESYSLVRRIDAELHQANPRYSVEDIRELLRGRPDLARLREHGRRNRSDSAEPSASAILSA